MKADGKPILNHSLVKDLLDALLLPSAIAVCNCQAHTTGKDEVCEGNRKADLAAKAAALLPLSVTRAVKLAESPESLGAIQTMQQFSSDLDKRQWKQAGANYIAGVWMGPDDEPCLPKHFFSAYARLTHGLDHASKKPK